MQPKLFPNHKITETGENLSRGSPFFRSLLGILLVAKCHALALN